MIQGWRGFIKPCLNTATTKGYPLVDDIRYCARYGYEGIEVDTSKLEEYLRKKNLSDLKRLRSDPTLLKTMEHATIFYNSREYSQNRYPAA